MGEVGNGGNLRLLRVESLHGGREIGEKEKLRQSTPEIGVHFVERVQVQILAQFGQRDLHETPQRPLGVEETVEKSRFRRSDWLNGGKLADWLQTYVRNGGYFYRWRRGGKWAFRRAE